MSKRIRTGVGMLVLGWQALPAVAQNLAPVIDARGVINAATQQPAPTSIAPGSILWVKGLNLGPAGGAVATPPLPTELGGVQVLINNRPSPILSAESSRIVVQVPWETPNGTMQVVVRRNGTNSRPARINVLQVLPAVITQDDKGYGEVKSAVSGKTLTFSASGLGPTDPRLNDGETGSSDTASKPRQDVHVHIGGMPVAADIRASDKRVGEFDITVELPSTALPGDLVTVEALNRPANFAAWRAMPSTRAEVTWMALPAGSPEPRAIASSDLRGGFLLASAARTDDGCWPSMLIDLRARQITNVAQCLTIANRNAPSPVVATQNGAALAAFVGPPQGDGTQGQGISSKVTLFQPGRPEPMTVELPAAGSTILGLDATSFAAILPGTPPQVATIDTDSGAVQTATAGAGGLIGIGVGGPGGGGGGGGLNPANLRVDLGDGLNHVLSQPINIGQGVIYVVVGDDENNPKKAKLAILNQQAEVTGSRDFPDGWLPAILPPAPLNPGGGGGIGMGLPGGGGGLQIVAFRLRLNVYMDAQTRVFFVAVRRADNSADGLAAFAPGETRVIAAPDKAFIATCTPTPQLIVIETSRRIVFPGTNVAETEFKRVCPALSFLVFDLATNQFTQVELPGRGQVNATAGLADLNDFILAPNLDADTVFAVDGVTLTAYRFDLPTGLVGFADLRPVPEMEMAIGTGRARQNGDGGFVIFDLQNIETRQLLLPDGFANVQFLSLLPATRKLVARGNRAGGAGSAYLIYDLLTGEVLLPENPPGVAFVGNAPQPGQPQPQQAPILQRVNPKANTIEAITFGSDRRPNGAMLIRVP